MIELARLWTASRTWLSVAFVSGDIASVAGIQEFYVAQVTLDNGDKVFQIRAWVELGDIVFPASRVETSSWGAIKAAY